MTVLQAILQGLGAGALLLWVCAVGIRKGAVNMLHLYSAEVQQRCVALGLTTRARIRRNGLILKAICLPLYITYVWICVYAINGAQDFWASFRQCFVILFVMNLIDRFLIDELWVGRTKAWVISGTEDLMSYISKADKRRKWIAGMVSTTVLSAAFAGLGILLK